MASQEDISFYKGEDITLTVTMAPATVITGWTLAFKLRKTFGDTVLVTKTTGGSGITITDATNGVFTVTIPKASTQDLDARAYVFDVARTDSGFQKILTIGALTLLPEVNL